MTTGRLSIELLEAFVAIAKTGNITNAGIELNRSQPCISTQLKRLEERVGKALIDRSERRIGLTHYGEILLENAEDILRSYEITKQRLSTPELSGIVHVGLPEWFATHKLNSIFCNFSRVHPNVKLKMTIADSDTLHKMLEKNELNLALALTTDSKPEPQEVVNEPLVWVSNQHIEVNTKDIGTKIPLILFNEPCPFRDAIFNTLKIHDLKWDERFTTTSVAAAQVAISSGLGVGVLPAGAVKKEFRILTQEDGLPPLQDTSLAIYKSDAKSCRTVEFLAAHLSDFMKQTIAINSTLSTSLPGELKLA
ncbi:MAG: LysR family transcriptional regulator [Nitratireductor sp.]